MIQEDDRFCARMRVRIEKWGPRRDSNATFCLWVGSRAFCFQQLL